MAILSDYTTGTVSASAGGIVVTGTGTAWAIAGFREGDIFVAPGWASIIQSVDSNTQLTLYPIGVRGGALSGSSYRIRYMSDGSRVSAQARQLIELLGGSGNLEALSSLVGLPDTFPMFTGPGAMTLVDKRELVNGVHFDVQVDTIAERAAYNSQDEGFVVLVSNTGDGRSAVYTRVGAAGNWSAPAYITGPTVTLNVTEVDEVPYGDPPDVELTPVPGGYELAFEIPRGMIIQPGTTVTTAPGTNASATFVPITGGYQIDFSIPRGTVLTAGSVTTLPPGQPADVTFVPTADGYRLDFSIPRGPTGDITGVTPFWTTRLGADESAEAARAGLGAARMDLSEVVGIEPTIDLIFSTKDAIDPAWFTRSSGGTYFDPRGHMVAASNNEPRIEFDPATGELLGLLVEDQRTNLLWPSNDFSDSRWSKTRVAASLGPVIRGIQFWNWVPGTETETSHSMNQSPTFAALSQDTVFTSSIFVKQNGSETSRIAFRFADTIGFRAYVFFDLATGQFTGGHDDPAIHSARATHIGDGIYRIEISYIARATSTYATIQPHAASPTSNSTTTHNFNGVDGYLIACAQIEEGTFATSYIPTTSAAATRAHDLGVVPNDVWWNESEWTVAFEADWTRATNNSTGGNMNITVGAHLYADANNRMRVLAAAGQPANQVQLNGRVENTATTRTSPAIGSIPEGVNKLAMTLKEGVNAKLSVNGGVPVQLNQAGVVRGNASLHLGKWQTNADLQNGHIRRVTYFPRTLTNAQLQAITA